MQALRPSRFRRALGCAAVLLPLGTAAFAETIGEVDTVFKFIGPDHKIVVEVFDDPKVNGVSCFLSRAKTGGIKGALGLAEDKAEASVACRQVGDIAFASPVPKQEEVFTERASILFKRIRVVRMVDPKRNALVYLVYSDRLIEGSPQNSITAVPIPGDRKIPLR
ncbi:MAG TPA: CreA family protein [Noviherbaspirillum sp.]